MLMAIDEDLTTREELMRPGRNGQPQEASGQPKKIKK